MYLETDRILAQMVTDSYREKIWNGSLDVPLFHRCRLCQRLFGTRRARIYHEAVVCGAELGTPG